MAEMRAKADVRTCKDALSQGHATGEQEAKTEMRRRRRSCAPAAASAWPADLWCGATAWRIIARSTMAASSAVVVRETRGQWASSLAADATAEPVAEPQHGYRLKWRGKITSRAP